MFLACLFLKLILYWIQKTMFACSFLNWNQTQNKTLPRRELRENLGWGLVTYSYSLNVWRKIKGKKQHWTCRWEKMSKAVEENKLTVMIRRFLWEFNLYCKFMYPNENNDKSKTSLPPPPPTPSTPDTVFLNAEKN